MYSKTKETQYAVFTGEIYMAGNWYKDAFYIGFEENEPDFNDPGPEHDGCHSTVAFDCIAESEKDAKEVIASFFRGERV